MKNRGARSKVSIKSCGLTILSAFLLASSLSCQRGTPRKVGLPQPAPPLDRKTVPVVIRPTPEPIIDLDPIGPSVENALILPRYEEKLLSQNQASGRSTLLVFTKADCPNCRLQVPTLARLLKEKEFKNIDVLQIDYVNQTQLTDRFNVHAWSALVGMKGSEIRFRSVGLINPKDLRHQLRRIL